MGNHKGTSQIGVYVERAPDSRVTERIDLGHVQAVWSAISFQPTATFRGLAKQLTMAPTTVQDATKLLASRGYIARRGRGQKGWIVHVPCYSQVSS